MGHQMLVDEGQPVDERAHLAKNVFEGPGEVGVAGPLDVAKHDGPRRRVGMLRRVESDSSRKGERLGQHARRGRGPPFHFSNEVSLKPDSSRVLEVQDLLSPDTQHRQYP